MTRPLVIAMIAATCCAPVRAADDARVAAGIERITAHLYDQQDPDTGTWEHLDPRSSTYQGGVTALVTLALVASGQSPQDPRLARAIEYLRHAPMKRTYCVALRVQLWARLPQAYLPLLKRDARWLADAARSGSTFGYAAWRDAFDAPDRAAAGNGQQPRRSNAWTPLPGDHSNSQYALMALFDAAQRGVEIDHDFWLAAAEHWQSTQNPDGGWNYGLGHDRPSYRAMTVAGLAALLAAQHELYRDRPAPQPQLAAAVARGTHWLERHFNSNDAVLRDPVTMYDLFGFQRLGQLTGQRWLADRDWFDLGAELILRRAERTGDVGSIVDSALALLFLSRSRTPVWAVKLTTADQPWNQRPNDLARLTALLARQSEAALDWQAVEIDRDADDWPNAPLAYLSTGVDLAMTAAQQANLKRWLDRGGTLLVNPENESESLAQSIRQLAQQLYPQWPIAPLPGEHGLFDLWQPAPASDGPPVLAVTNGVRALIVVADGDWGYQFQSQDDADGRSWRLASNLFALTSDRGRLPHRLAPRFEPRIKSRVESRIEPRKSQAADRRITVGRASYDGNWLPEPAAWLPVATRLTNRAGIALSTRDVKLEAIGQTDLPLVHLAGVGDVALSAAQREAIAQYVQRGGTLLVETVGGRGPFAESIERQLVAVFRTAPVRLPDDDALVTGAGLEGGYAIDHVEFRSSSAAAPRVPYRPRLNALIVGGRPAVIISRHDLSAGALGVRWHGIEGYAIESARQVLVNVALRVRASVRGKVAGAEEPRPADDR